MKGASQMSPDELRTNAKAYLDDMIEIQGGNPSSEDYETALESVEDATRDLVATRAESVGCEA
jgi:hypothetical protein